MNRWTVSGWWHLQNEQWWYLQWDDDMYNEIMVIFMMRYLQWDTDDIYDEALILIQMRWEMMIYICSIEFYTPIPYLSPLLTDNFNDQFFLWCHKTSGLKKVLLQSGHTNLTIRCTLLTWVADSSPVRLMGPLCSPQPGIGTLIWCPQLNSEGLHVSRYVSHWELKWQLEGADTVAWPTGSETSGPVDSWGGCWEMEELGLRWGCGKGGWDRRRREHEVILLSNP